MNTHLKKTLMKSVTNEFESLPNGYKRTEIGIIPIDWEEKKVKEVGSVKGGKRLPKGRSLTSIPTPYPYIRVADMTNGGVKLDDIMYVPEDIFPKIKNYRLYVEDLFISVAGTLGIVGIVPPALNGANLTENADRITNISCDRDFLLFCVMTDKIQGEIESQKTVGAQPKLALGRIENFKIALPREKTEQRAIAAALSDVDNLITALDKLIAKKRAIKQATMQQLLTGKTRLPGFSGEWAEYQLGDLGQFYKGRGINRDDVIDDGVYCIRYGELYTTYHDYLTIPSSHISRDTAKTALPIKTDDLLFAGSGETAEEIGSCAAYLGEEEAYAGGDIIVLRPQGQNSLYLGHLMNHSTVVAQKSRLGQGDAVVHISARNLSRIVIVLPEVDEQDAIAEVLLNMDSEIKVLEQRRDKSKAIKQGMMQELLTGRTRLI